METKTQVPAAVEALRNLKSEVHGPEDEAVLKQWRQEIGQERAKAVSGLGKEAVNLVGLPGGTVEPLSNVAELRDQGQDVAVHTTAGRQS